MNLAAPFIARLEAQVPALVGRVRGAADLASLMSRAVPSPQAVLAHVVPLGMAGGPNVAVGGAFRQAVTRRVAVLLTIRSQDPTGAQTVDTVEDLIEAIAAAIAGWTPAATAKVFVLEEASLAGFEGGTLVYQITFALGDEIRSPV